jgi:hypothetical protein
MARSVPTRPFSATAGWSQRLVFNPAAPREHYENLELIPGPTATRKRIKEQAPLHTRTPGTNCIAQFQRLAKLWHPDRRPDDPEAHEKFAKISASYRILTDTESRRDYDRWLSETERVVTGAPRPPVWTRQRPAKPAESFKDDKADAFRDARERMTGRAWRPSPSAASKDYYNSVENPAWRAERKKNREENSRVLARRHYDTEDKFKLWISMAIVLFAAVLVRDLTDDNVHYEELKRSESRKN